MTLLLVTAISMVLAAIISAVAWRSSHEERRLSEARIAALAAEIHDQPEMGAPVAPGVTPASDLFAARQPARGGVRFATVAAAGLFICGSGVALAVVSSSASGNLSHPAASTTVDHRVERPDAATPEPIELVALGHEREGDRLVVRGIVRNPSSGAALDRVTAVVLLFKEDGGFLGSGRASVESPALGPGGETSFAVTVPGASNVGRYRVSFRTADRVVAHIDRRGKT